MHQLGRFAGSAAGQIARFQQQHPRPAPGGIARHACPVDPAADDDEIERLRHQWIAHRGVPGGLMRRNNRPFSLNSTSPSASYRADEQASANGRAVPSIGLADDHAHQRGTEHAEEGLHAGSGPGDLRERLHRDRPEVGTEEPEQGEVEGDQRQEPPQMAGVRIGTPTPAVALTAMNISTPVCDTRRAPNRITIRELVMLATAIIPAVAPNTIGNAVAHPEMPGKQLLCGIDIAKHPADHQRGAQHIADRAAD